MATTQGAPYNLWTYLLTPGQAAQMARGEAPAGCFFWVACVLQAGYVVRGALETWSYFNKGNHEAFGLAFFMTLNFADSSLKHAVRKGQSPSLGAVTAYLLLTAMAFGCAVLVTFGVSLGGCCCWVLALLCSSLSACCGCVQWLSTWLMGQRDWFVQGRGKCFRVLRQLWARPPKAN